MNIAREGGRRTMAIGIFIKDRDMGSVVKDMQARVNHAIKLPESATPSPGRASSRTRSGR